MRILILTQIVDERHPTLGFFHRWIAEFAKHCEQVLVVCLFEGTHSLPHNVRVLSLGKEQRRSRAQYLWRFFLYVWKYRCEYEAVFAHMNHEYVLLGGVLWRLWGKRIGLWYAHGTVSFSLRLAERLAHIVITSTPEGFRLPSDKTHVVGQGIDTDFFVADSSVSRGKHVLSAGRLSARKRHDLAIRAVSRAGRALRIAGDGPERAALEALARAKRARVVFLGALTRERLRAEYRCARALAHTSETGSLDKVVLEALACGTPVVTTNRALGCLPVAVAVPTSEALAEALRVLPAPQARFSEYVRREHSLRALIPRILAILAPPKSVLVATGLYPPEIGGPATYAELLVKRLPERGWQVDVLPFCTVRHLPKGLRHMVYFAKCVARALRARAILALDPVSVGLPALIAARLLRRRFFLRLGGDYAWEQGRLRFGVVEGLAEFNAGGYRRARRAARLLRRVEAYVALRARRIAVQSNEMKNVVARWGAPEERIVVIPNGYDAPADLPERQAARRALGLSGSVAVSAARLVPHKGMAGLISAVPDIRVRVPDFTLVIIGDGPERAVLEALARSRGVAGAVVFVGRVARSVLLRYLAAADAYTQNSEYEGFSHTVLEAYAAGAPVVAADIPGNAGVVEREVSGLLVPPRDTKALAVALVRVLRDTLLRGRLCAGGGAKLREFSEARVLVATDAFLS